MVELVLLEAVFVVGMLTQAALATRAGMRVELVSFGYGPRLWRRGRLQLALFPLGGFVRVAGLHPTEQPADERAFAARPWLRRALVVLGWPIGAQLFLMALNVGVALLVGVPGSLRHVEAVLPGSPAEIGGLRPGDDLVRYGFVNLEGGPMLDELVAKSRGFQVEIKVRRGGELVRVWVTPLKVDGEYRLGVQLAPALVKLSPLAAARRPFQRQAAILGGVKELVTGRVEAELAGPIAMAQLISSTALTAIRVELQLTFLSYLVLLTLLPLPPLPGFQLLALLVGRRRAPEAARDAGEVAATRPAFPVVLLVALLPLALAAAAPFSTLEVSLATINAIGFLLLAAALASGHPRAWAWGICLPSLSILTALLTLRGLDRLAGVALPLVVTLTLILPPVRRYFGQTCAVCRRLAARPVRSAPRMCCLACGSVWTRCPPQA